MDAPPLTQPGIGFRLTQARTRRGLSLRVVGRMMGCSHKWIEQMESGARSVSVPWLARLAPLYLVSTDWLIFGGDRSPAAEEGRVAGMGDAAMVADALAAAHDTKAMEAREDLDFPQRDYFSHMADGARDAASAIRAAVNGK